MYLSYSLHKSDFDAPVILLSPQTGVSRPSETVPAPSLHSSAVAPVVGVYAFASPRFASPAAASERDGMTIGMYMSQSCLPALRHIPRGIGRVTCESGYPKLHKTNRNPPILPLNQHYPAIRS